LGSNRNDCQRTLDSHKRTTLLAPVSLLHHENQSLSDWWQAGR
jgi:hypothetical protein